MMCRYSILCIQSIKQCFFDDIVTVSISEDYKEVCTLVKEKGGWRACPSSVIIRVAPGRPQL